MRETVGFGLSRGFFLCQPFCLVPLCSFLLRQPFRLCLPCGLLLRQPFRLGLSRGFFLCQPFRLGLPCGFVLRQPFSLGLSGRFGGGLALGFGLGSLGLGGGLPGQIVLDQSLGAAARVGGIVQRQFRTRRRRRRRGGGRFGRGLGVGGRGVRARGRRGQIGWRDVRDGRGRRRRVILGRGRGQAWNLGRGAGGRHRLVQIGQIGRAIAGLRIGQRAGLGFRCGGDGTFRRATVGLIGVGFGQIGNRRAVGAQGPRSPRRGGKAFEIGLGHGFDLGHAQGRGAGRGKDRPRQHGPQDQADMHRPRYPAANAFRAFHRLSRPCRRGRCHPCAARRHR